MRRASEIDPSSSRNIHRSSLVGRTTSDRWFLFAARVESLRYSKTIAAGRRHDPQLDRPHFTPPRLSDRSSYTTCALSQSRGPRPKAAGPDELISSDEQLPRVTIIIPTRDHLELLKPCIESIEERSVYPQAKIEIIVVDNGLRAKRL